MGVADTRLVCCKGDERVWFCEGRVEENRLVCWVHAAGVMLLCINERATRVFLPHREGALYGEPREAFCTAGVRAAALVTVIYSLIIFCCTSLFFYRLRIICVDTACERTIRSGEGPVADCSRASSPLQSFFWPPHWKHNLWQVFWLVSMIKVLCAVGFVA